MRALTSPLCRKLIQIAAFGFCNPHVRNIAGGKLYSGAWKNFCAPGLNCYSCPAATLSCPIGALQAVSGSLKFSFSFYVTGILLAFGAVLGRAVCGFLCPFGLVQELLHKIPSPKVRLPRPLRFVKYAVLALFVLILPVASSGGAGVGDPAFCEYICPAGTLEGGIPMVLAHEELRSAVGGLFALKCSILLLTLVGCLFISRFFCKLLCPLGAIYGLCNKISLLRLHVDGESCVGCGLCHARCPMDVDPVRQARSAECIRCGTCAQACPKGAIRLGFSLG